MNTVIVIPTYNEAINIEKIIGKIFDEIFKEQKISVLVVDSASPDGTGDVVEKLQNKYSDL